MNQGLINVIFLGLNALATVFPLVLGGYHTYLSQCRGGMTTNESCRGKKLPRKYSSNKQIHGFWNPRDTTD
jgi:hypothetical protein